MSNGRIIYYWSGVVGDESLREQYADVLEKLLNGDTNSVTCHKLKNCKGLYSVYADGKDRLIFTEKMINGKNCIVVLKSLPNHDYQKLDAKVLKRHVDRNSELFISQLEAQEEELKWEELDAAEVKKIFADGKSAQPNHLSFKSLEFFNQLFVELNIAQESAKHARFPLLISGAPGTGKSLVALLLLKKGEPGEKYCYVAKSSNLVNEMREQWGEMSAEMGELPYMVEFYTYDELLSKVSQELKLGLENKTWVDGAAFATWFSEYLKKKKGIFKTAGIEELVAKVTGNVDKVYQELKIVAVYGELQYVGSEEEKKQRVEGEQPCSRLGKRQSLFEVKEERALIWRIYSAYRDSLESKKQIDVALYSAESTSLFKRLIVDEAQDLSYAQLQVLYQLTDDIGLCMDSHQNIADYLSKRPFILSMLGEHATHIQLPVGYRCTQLMVDILNEWMRMGYEAVGGLSDADEYSKITLEDERAKKMGRTRYCADFARIPTIMRELKEKHGAAEMAVVIAEESMREEAIKIYGTEQVFTATEIKGLEYKAVIVHRLLDKDECKEINKRLQENVGNAKETINRPKNNDSHMDLSPAVCEVFTALSRATEELVLCQEDKHEMALIAERLKKKIPPADVYEKPKTQSKGKGKEKVRLVEQFVLTEVVLTELEIKAWLAKVVKLIKAGAIKQAHDVFTNTLKKSEAEYNAFYELHKPKSRAQAQAASTTSKMRGVLFLAPEDSVKIKKIETNLDELDDLFASPDTFKHLLFLTGPGENKNLFYRIFTQPSLAQELLKKIKKYPDILQIIMNEIFSVRYTYDAIRLNYFELIHQAPDVKQAFMDLLEQMLTSELLTCAILFKEGGKYFEEFLRNESLRPFMDKFLYRRLRLKEYYDSYCTVSLSEGSAHVMLSKYVPGLLLCSATWLSENYPSISDAVALFSPAGEFIPDVFYWLARSYDSHNFLYQSIFRNDSSLLKKVSYELLSRRQASIDGRNECPLEALIVTEAGNEILLLLVHANPSILANFSDSFLIDLCKISVVKSELVSQLEVAMAKRSQALSKTAQKSELKAPIRNIASVRPSKGDRAVKSQSSNTVSHKQDKFSEVFRRNSEDMVFIFNRNKFIEYISDAAFRRELIKQYNENQLPFLSLKQHQLFEISKDTEGADQSIFTLIHARYPDLSFLVRTKLLSLDYGKVNELFHSLCRPIVAKTKTGEIRATSLLLMIVHYPDQLALLWRSDNNLAKLFTETVLCRITEFYQLGEGMMTSAFEMLCRSKPVLLAMLEQITPGFIRQIKPANMLRIIKANNSVPLFLLGERNDQLFKDWIEHAPWIDYFVKVYCDGTSLTPEAHTVRMMVFTHRVMISFIGSLAYDFKWVFKLLDCTQVMNKVISSGVYRRFSDAIADVTIFNFICMPQFHSYLAKFEWGGFVGLQTEHLTRMVGPGARHSPYNVLSMLLITNDGISFLLKIFKSRVDIAKEVVSSGKLLNSFSFQKDGENKEYTSAYERLEETLAGREIIQYLKECVDIKSSNSSSRFWQKPDSVNSSSSSGLPPADKSPKY